VDNWRNDLTYAVRSLLAARKFSATVILTLALGLGANTAVFSVLHAVVLTPLPYPAAERLIRLYKFRAGEDNYLPGPAAIAFRDQSTTIDFAPVYTYAAEGADLTDRAEPERVSALRVGADYFRVLGVQPLAGQPFDRTAERADAGVVVIRERLWREYLGARPDAIGESLSINGVRQQVVAVLPDSFADPLVSGVEVWTPLDLQTPARNRWGNHYLSVIGRLRPGVTLEQARADTARTAALVEKNYGDSTPVYARVTPLQLDTVGAARGVLWILLGAVGVLLTIACVNVAGLVLARGAAREPELAIRAALGGSRWRLARQLVLESLLLSLAGGLVGLASARLVTRVLIAAAPESIARVARDGGDGITVFAFGFLVALGTGLVVGLVPALQQAKPNLEGVLRESGRGTSGGRRQARMRRALVVSQIALAVVLLAGAGLLLRSFERLSTVQLGVRPENVLTFSVNLPAGRYADPQRRAEFHLAFQDRLAAIAGVKSAGAVSRLPVTGSYHTWSNGRVDQPDTNVAADQRVVEGRFFEALGIRVIQGRTFTREDGATPRIVVINERLARTLFPSENPIGQRLRVSGAGPGGAEIVGVVANVANAARTPPPAIVYHLHRQFAADRIWALTDVVASDRPADALLDDVRRELRALDPSLVLYQPRMLTDVIGRGIAQERFAMLVVTAYAALALTLAAVGLYGLLSYMVGRRQREIGIRLALGAQTQSVRALVVREGGALAVLGVVAGLAAAVAVTRALGSLLYGISARDPLTFALAGAVLLAIGLVASWLPARAAARIDPIHALRGDV
jgi:putative ABC transport system permease protein